ncbi:MAG: Glu/Leu/Phe/Val dehydrogenase [Bdellovibrionales bacterium]|nr:Glu/Leu/Phe/Val dehydrogenase [Bdellovibrionales bacterium]
MTFLVPELTQNGFEHISFFYDRKTAIKAIVSIHNTSLGPSLGGCRFYPYASTDAALKDVMRLSEAMTYKAAVADLPLGGGKAVIFGNPKSDKSPEKLKAFGSFVERLGGAYITTVDSGTTSEDMIHVQSQTSHVVGVSSKHGGSDDPSPNTAIGVFEGIKACLETQFGSPEIKGRHFAIQGIGNVGYRLAKLLRQAGAKLSLADVQEEKLKVACKELDADQYTTESIFSVACDVFSPCAMGGVISQESLGRIKAPIIAGAANNQLADASVAKAILEKNILYAPDFVINAGGLIHVALDLKILNMEQIEEKTRKIGQTLKTIFERSKATTTPTHQIAIEFAKEKLH